jgi:hypothetical protein
MNILISTGNYPIKKSRIFTDMLKIRGKSWQQWHWAISEPVYLNVYGAQESIPRNEFRQPM